MKAATFDTGIEVATATTRRGAMRSGALLAPLALAPLAVAPLATVGASSRLAPAVGPLTHPEAALPRLEETLRQHIVGQGHVVATVAGAVRRWQAGLSDPQRPVPSFLFLGPAGVGKTVLVKALAQALFGAAGALTRLDASAHGAQLAALAAAVSRRPQQVILLDEVERAQPEVRAALEQILETGRLADGRGRTVDFRNTVVIMTATTAAASGLNSADGADGVASQSGAAGPDRPGTPAGLRPELLERIHEVVTFEHLTAAQRRLVAARMARRGAPA